MTVGRSLHIGLEYVDADAYSHHWAVLWGCKNDALAMRDFAAASGFSMDPPLVNEMASRRSIEDAITTASRRLERGDFFFVSYSGHAVGSPAASNGYQECWVTFDGYLPIAAGSRLWSRFKPGVRIVVVSDSCGAPPMPGMNIGTAPARTVDTARARVLFIGAGARGGQVSPPPSSNHCSPFTATLLDLWSETRCDLSNGFDELVRRLARRLPAEQLPRCEILEYEDPSAERVNEATVFSR